MFSASTSGRRPCDGIAAGRSGGACSCAVKLSSTCLAGLRVGESSVLSRLSLLALAHIAVAQMFTFEHTSTFMRRAAFKNRATTAQEGESALASACGKTEPRQSMELA
eukprot:252481-Pleurochrysis_carterae.AAC.4